MVNVTIQKNEFDLFVTYFRDACGIQLDDTKVGLVESRLSDLLENHNFLSYMDLYREATANDALATKLVDAITTNETYFFRDRKIFESLMKHLFESYLDISSSLQIWSAACSYGQEPYTLAIVLKELVYAPSKFTLQITGTDISTRALSYASRGIYSEFEVGRGLDDKRISRNFEKQKNGHYKIKDELRSLVHFKKFNLIKPIVLPRKFQIVLCRNVAMYFDAKTKKRIYENIANMMVPGGILIIGATEILIDIGNHFVQREWNNIFYYQIKDNC